MPRPTTAQLAYGSLTVVLSTFAMLLLSDVRSGAGVAVVSVAALILGLLVAVTVSVPNPARGRSAQETARAIDGRSASVPVPRSRVAGGGPESRVGEHSLRR